MSPQMATLFFHAMLSPLIIPAVIATAASATGFLSPLLSPVIYARTWGVGRASTNVTSLYECVCDPGWKQTVSDDPGLRFLPCVVPNCWLFSVSALRFHLGYTLQCDGLMTASSCSAACRWVDCGGGTCNETSAFSYCCICEAGYSNLLNISAFPCYQQWSSNMRGIMRWSTIFVISLIAAHLHQ